MLNIGDFVTWIDQDHQNQSGVIAFIAHPNTRLPKEYFKEGAKYKSRQTTFGRYIADCTMFGEWHISKIGTESVCYRAISFNNKTVQPQPLPIYY